MPTDSEYESEPMASGQVQGGDNLAPENLDENKYSDQTCGSLSSPSEKEASHPDAGLDEDKGFKEYFEQLLHSTNVAKEINQELEELRSVVNELLSFSST
ncbi:unnamed protein product [Fusarium fujikuroi]|uniref:Uncharacterized protein n=1 Tax=Fusarium fujikuroi TaxID=5127 RepID=A0A9Q9RTZ5_FUSFU|nr:uncharacterized protein FFE2_04892 [Fusarium fujikuroi]SCV35379.1 uncharacterized protein FFFS_04708 [Fusarium fujikuroi]VTT63518.1 unnamed protein product [Fusarium fujikuroi]VTT73815.1 unnamed protein product [Fusarium fujikuroi]VZI04253.1 unnamed protein product [Fusarium fujikuroi]